MPKLAIDGGKPVRDSRLPYGRQSISEEDIAAVADVLRSDWLTTGPKVADFEDALKATTTAQHAVAVSSGTAALHCAMAAINVQPGDEVIVTPLTFAASANSILYRGARPVFVDVLADMLTISPDEAEAAITPKTKAIVAVDYGGQPASYRRLRYIADQHGLVIIGDACHAIGATFAGEPVGTLADLSTFSFHPVKHIATGEGGAITTHNAEWAQAMRTFRNHGITTDHHQREQTGSWFYEMQELGYNYRITDFQCVLGIQQLKRLDQFIARRREIAAQYDAAFEEIDLLEIPALQPEATHSYHLYLVLLQLDGLSVDRKQVFDALRAEGIGVNVHYIPVYWHPYYQKLGYQKGLCWVAEHAYWRLLSLPIFPDMSDDDVQDVITAVNKVLDAYRIH